MKRDVTDYVSKCLTCQQVKAEHQVPIGLLNSLPIPQWKRDNITMDFVSGFPLTQQKHDSVWVIMDRLTKSAHFIPIRIHYSMDRLAELYVDEIVRLHGVSLSIVSDRDPRFTSRLWKELQSALSTKLNFSTAFHPQTNGQSERLIQVLEDMLRGYVIEFSGSWDRYIPLMEFAYNNSFQSSIGMAPYETLYGRKCRTPVCWTELNEHKLIGPDIVKDTEEKVQVIRQRLKAAIDRQKSYANCGPYPIHGPARFAFKWKENVKRKCGLIFEFWKIRPRGGTVFLWSRHLLLFLFLSGENQVRTKNPNDSSMEKSGLRKLDFWVRGSDYLSGRYFI